MDDVIKWVNLILSLLAFGVIGYLWITIRAQKATIEAQKTIVDSFKALNDSLKNLQIIWLNHIKDETFQNAVNYQVREDKLKLESKINELTIKDELTKEKVRVIVNELIRFKPSFYKLAVMAAGFKTLNEKAFISASDAIGLEKFELDEIEKVLFSIEQNGTLPI